MLGDYADIAVKLAKEAERKPKPKQTRDTGSSFFTKVRELARDEPAPPKGPPNPTLQKYGFHGTTQEFNNRVEVVVTEYQKIKGIDPSPGLVFDVARSQAPTETIPDLFGPLAFTKRAAQAAGLGGKVGAVAPSATNVGPAPAEPAQPDDVLATAFPDDPTKSFLDRSRLALARDAEKTLDKYINTATAGRSLVAAAGSKSTAAWADAYKEQALKDPAFADMDKQALGLLFDARTAAKLAGAASSFSGKFMNQIFETMMFFPLGMALAGREIGLDTFDLFRHGDLTPERSAQLGLQIAQTVYSDFENPEDSPGYLFMNLLGLTGAVGAVVTGGKIAKAGARAAREGGGVKDVVGELTNRPLPGRATVRIVGDEGRVFEQDFLLSGNAVVAAVQKTILGRRERRMNVAREQAMLEPAPDMAAAAVSGGVLDAARNFREATLDIYRSRFSLANKIGREMRAERRTQLLLDTRLKNVLAGLKGSALFAHGVLSKLPPSLRRGLTAAEDRAIVIEASNIPGTWQNRVDAWRGLHRTMIDDYADVYPAANHEAQLVVLDLAEKMLANPKGQSKRFQKALSAVRAASAKQAQIKKDVFGLSEGEEAWRIAFAGMVVENPKPTANLKRVEQRIDQTNKRLELARKDSENPQAVAKLKDDLKALLAEKETSEAAVFAQRAEAVNATIREGAAYIPFVSSLRIKTTPQGYRPPQVRPGKFGIPPEETYIPRELRNSFTGRSIIAGDTRYDTASLIGDKLGSVARAAIVVDQIRALMPLALDKLPKGDPRGYRPIRITKDIPDDLRKFLAADEPMLLESELAGLTPEAVQSIQAHYFPGVYDAKKNTWILPEGIEDVKWIPEGAVADALAIPRKPGAFSHVVIGINEPFKIGAILSTPKYLLNALGNAAMLWVDQGIFRMGHNVTRALAIQAFPEKFYGRENLAAMRTLGRVGKARAYNPSIKGAELITKLSSNMGAAWSVITDETFRLASVDYYMRRYRSAEFPRGIQTEADATRFFNSRDPKIRKDVDQIGRLANKAVVEFDNLTQFEKDYMRTAIFVYPWVSRSAVWSVRAILEHPVRADVLVQLAREAEGEYPDYWDNVVGWIKKRGYVPYGLTDSLNPIVGDYTSVNSFATLFELYDVAKAGVWGARYSSLEDILGPAARFFIHGAEGKDKYGNDYAGPQWWSALKEVYVGLPFFGPAKIKPNEPLPPLNPLDRQNLISRLKAAAAQTALNPSAWNGWQRVLFGGPVPRELNKLAAIGKYWRDQPALERLKHENELILIRLRSQAKTLKETLPAEVLDAVKLNNEWALANRAWQQENGDDPPPKQAILNLIEMLVGKRRMDEEAAENYRKSLAPMKLAEELSEVSKSIGLLYMNGAAMEEWDTRVGVVSDAAFKSAELQRRLDLLAERGLIPKTLIKDVKQENLWEYGRKVLGFYDEINTLRREKDGVGKTPADRALIEARIASLEAKADVPFYVDGVALPSPPRMVWGHLTAEDQETALRGWAGTSWTRLSPLAKELLGRKPETGAQFGWERFTQIKAEVRAKMPVDDRNLVNSADYGVELAKYVDRYYAPGFYKDYLFSRQPLVQRLMYGGLVTGGKLMPPLEDSPHRETWVEVLAVAAPYAKGIAAGAPKTATRETWKTYVEKSLLPWLRAERPGFVKELALYPQSFLYGLLDG